MILLRWRWRRQGTHIQVRVFTADVPALNQEPAPAAWAFCGHLSFSVHDWLDIVAALGPRVDLVEYREEP
jgi:hypothetical protein